MPIFGQNQIAPGVALQYPAMKCMTAVVCLKPVHSVELALPLMLGAEPALLPFLPILMSIRPFPWF